MRLPLSVANAVIRALLEPGCAACGQLLQAPLARAVCDACWTGVIRVSAPFCQICGDELTGLAACDAICGRCQQHPPAFSFARSAGRHDGPLRAVVHAFKFDRRRLLAEPLGQLLRESGKDVLSDVDAVVPVPLHPIRSLQRGFNQADDLARQLNRPVWRVLRKRRHGPSQASLPAAKRRRNLQRDFAVSFRARLATRIGRRLDDTRLVLIDDVMTTGATLDACARVLREAGAAEVRALTVSRAVGGQPPRPDAPPRPSTPRR